MCTLCCLKSLCFSCCVSSGKTWSRELQLECCGQWKSVESDVKTPHLLELCGNNFPWPESFGEAFRSYFWLRFLLSILLIFNYNDAKKCSPNWSRFWLQIFLCWAGSLAPRTRHKVTATCVETLYSAFARAYKQGGMDGTSARQLNHRQAVICVFPRFLKTQGGYWNWSAILETFCEADCGVGICLFFGCSAWDWYFLAILLSAKQSGSCCWRPGLCELSHGTLARI